MVVLSGSGVLVGTISRAYQDFAWIRLITDPESAVNAQINLTAAQPQATTPSAPTPTPAPATTPAPTPSASPLPAATPPANEASAIRGVAAGDLKDGLVLDLLPSDVAIGEGSLVLSSGLGGNYPRGLLIGTVTDLEQRPQSPFTKAKVEPAASLSGLDTVLILISFVPARLSEP